MVFFTGQCNGWNFILVAVGLLHILDNEFYFLFVSLVMKKGFRWQVRGFLLFLYNKHVILG